MTRAPLACPTCGGELVRISPDGASCVRGHFVPRDPATGKLLARRDGEPEPLEPAARADVEARASRGTGGPRDVPQSWVPVAIIDLDEADATTEWIWEGFLARGHLTDLYALWKSGKTTLLAAFLHRLGTGGELAGRAVRRGRALVVSEEPKAKWHERRHEFALDEHVHLVSRPFAKRPTYPEWLQFCQFVQGLVAERGYDVVVFDSLPNLWPVADENSASDVIGALMPLQAIASAGAAVLMVRHPRKADGNHGTAGRGSGAIAAFADIIVEMRRYETEQHDDTRRTITVYSRYEPFEVVIRWRGGADYETLGTPAQYSTAEQRERVFAAVAEQPGATTDEVARHSDLPYATASKRLHELLAAGRVRRDGAGKRGDPYRWYPVDFVSSPIGGEREEKKSPPRDGSHDGFVSSHIGVEREEKKSTPPVEVEFVSSRFFTETKREETNSLDGVGNGFVSSRSHPYREETNPRRMVRCVCGGILQPSDRAGWLRCTRCRNYVRSDDPALGREKGVTR